MSGKYALIIGNTEYIDPGLAQLTAPSKDAEDFARVLKDHEIGAFDDVNVLLNQPEPAVRGAIDEFFDQKKPDDLLVLYFSGHGVRDELGSLYLAVKNTMRSRLRSTAVKSDYIREAMDQSRSRRQVLILDCCNSGAFPHGTKAATGVSFGTASAFESGYGRIILTASDATQFAWEGNQVIGETDNSLFTHYLVEGLEGEADQDSDGRITVDELYDYAYEKVRLATPKQTPSKFSSKQQGEIVLRQNIPVEDIKPVPLPTELIDEIQDTRPYVREVAVQKLERLLKAKNIGLARSAREALEKIVADENTTRRVMQTAIQALHRADEEQKAREEIEHIALQKAGFEPKISGETPQFATRAEGEGLAPEGAGTDHGAAKQIVREGVGREAMELISHKKADQGVVERKEVHEGKVTQPSWLRFGIIGSVVILLALGGYGTRRFVTEIIGQFAAGVATSTDVVTPASTAPVATTVVETNTPNIPTITPTSIFYPLEITDSKGVEMVLIPAGEFTMGSTMGNPDEQPVHKFHLDGFYIDKFEVTNLLYKACVDSGICDPPQRSDSYTHIYYYGSATFGFYPVIYIDWHMAKTYCEWRGARLPTEAEWEKAARGTDGHIYPWGNSIDCSFANYLGGEKGCLNDTARIGSYEDGKSIYGSYDMAGNVWEWVGDLYRPYPYSSTDGRQDSNVSGNRVLRGGAWNVDGNAVRSSLRFQYEPTSSDGVIGFRCADNVSP